MLHTIIQNLVSTSTKNQLKLEGAKYPQKLDSISPKFPYFSILQSTPNFISNQPQLHIRFIGDKTHLIGSQYPFNLSQLIAPRPITRKPQIESLKLKFTPQAEIFHRQPKLAYKSFILQLVKLSFHGQSLIIT